MKTENIFICCVLTISIFWLLTNLAAVSIDELLITKINNMDLHLACECLEIGLGKLAKFMLNSYRAILLILL